MEGLTSAPDLNGCRVVMLARGLSRYHVRLLDTGMSFFFFFLFFLFLDLFLPAASLATMSACFKRVCLLLKQISRGLSRYYVGPFTDAFFSSCFCMPYMYALYVCLLCMPYMCMPYMYALYVCLLCMPYVCAPYRALCVCLICVPYMYALYVCLLCMPYMCMPYMYALLLCWPFH